MKAIVYRKYGPPDVLQLEEAEKPAPAAREVVVRVRAASVNPYDWHFLRGMPYFMRLAVGLLRPKIGRLGVDAAGVVEAVGKEVTRFKLGDEVFGGCRGAFAEYACASEATLASKPDGVSFEQAASVPIAGLTALQGLRDSGSVQAGQKVLINGAAGGVGTFAVQIAKWLGAEVTGVCSGKNAEMVRSIGADHTIDYAQEDFTKSARRYDAILDCMGNHSLAVCRQVLNPNGIHLLVGGPKSPWMFGLFVRVVASMVLPRILSQRLAVVMAKGKREDLDLLAELIRSGKIKPVIDRRYPLAEVAEAMRHLELGHARGKIIITVN
jgi:NADPH:quinone reductase-like Zn-dependent oxidoreductase